MKTKIIFLILTVGFLYNCPVFAQGGRPPHKVVKQQPRVSGAISANTHANAKAKIHANSNSVFGSKKTHPNYEKRNQSKKVVIKTEGQLKKGKEKKDKK
jgi:hypothetical protein